MSFIGNKQDILKYLHARATGYDIKNANQYFNLIEVIHITFYDLFFLI